MAALSLAASLPATLPGGLLPTAHAQDTQSEWQCTRCGKSNAGSATSCSRCGASRPDATPASPAKNSASPAPAKNSASPAPAKSEPARPEKKNLTEDQKAHIRSIEKYYTRMYAKHLDNRDWFVRALAVVGLARLQSDATTEKLLETLKTDRDSLVRVYAWEALHARQKTLTDEQRKTWVEQGLETALTKDGFRGDLRANLIRAMIPYGVDGLSGKEVRVIQRFIKETDHRDPKDHQTLKAIRDLLTQWQDRTLTKRLLTQMTKDGIANRVEYVVGGLNPDIETIGRCETKLPQKVWLKKRAEWILWLKEADLKPPAPGTLKPYQGKSRFLPPAETITDPNDPTWRDELEVDKLRVDEFDLVFVVDSTSSMTPVMEWLAKDLSKILSALKLYAREPRIGVVYYRHEVDESLMQPCCKARAQKDNDITATLYRVKTLPLTGKIHLLAKAMQAEKAHDGHFNPGREKNPIPSPGAVHGGLFTAITNQPWTKSSASRKIIVLVGDAPPTDKTMPKIKKLLAKATETGLKVNVLKVFMTKQYLPAKVLQGPGLSAPAKKAFAEFDQVAQWGKGRSMIGQFLSPPPKIAGQIAPPPDRRHEPFKALIAQIIRSTLPDGYQKRVDPFVEVLAEYVDATPPEKRRR